MREVTALWGITSHNAMQASLLYIAVAVAEIAFAGFFLWLYVSVTKIEFLDMILPSAVVALTVVMLPLTIVAALLAFTTSVVLEIVKLISRLFS